LTVEKDVRRAAEIAARESYGRLMAFLSARSRDVAAVEDALADAFRNALERWPIAGIPSEPEAWLLTAARRRLIDQRRHARVRDSAALSLLAAAHQAQEVTHEPAGFPDDRLKLLFVCAHPGIDAAARTPLMLQTVLGLDATRIAAAFLVRPTTMGQRLSRAKAKIRDAGIPFEVPKPEDLASRIDAVAEAIYAAYGSGWDDVGGLDARCTGLAREAIALGGMLARLMPEEPEVLGLVALMLHCEARHDARREASGAYVPLSQQDTARWSRPMIDEAESYLRKAATVGRAGRFQLEAAIQSAHAQRLRTGATDWQTIALLHEGLVAVAPTMGARVGRAAAVAEARDPDFGFRLLEKIPRDEAASYQPYWAVAAHLLRALGRTAEALEAYNLAIGLCDDPGMREWLRKQVPRE
jgi:RNA polymerase sigma-70 factor (ECF subfamily)